MSESNSNLQEMRALVEAMGDRTITDEQLARLNALLETDDAARSEYILAMRLEAELGAIHRSVDESLPAVGEAAPLAGPHRRGRFGRVWPMVLAVAASVVACVVAASWATYEGVHGRGPLASVLADDGMSGAAADEAPAVARVAATRNCRWGGKTAHSLDYGSSITTGQMLELQTGLAELNFANGARLVLEGPATFRVADPRTVEVYRGRVAAAVPTDAEGFSVRTPHLVVGEYASSAQFGVVADGQGADQIHVFEGVLRAQSIDQRGKVASAVELSSLEGAAVNLVDGEFSRFNADNEGFVRRIDVRNGPGDGLIAFDDFSYPVGPLGMQNGGFGWAGPWTVLEAEDESEAPAGEASGVAQGSLASSGLLALGNRFVQSDNFNRIRRVVSTNRGGVLDVAGCIEIIDAFPLVRRTGGTIYISFLQRVANNDGTFYGFELHRGDGRYNRVLCIGADVEGNGYGVAVDFQQPPGQPKFASLGKDDGQVNFIVVRIDYGENEQDKVTIYRNPESIVDESRCKVDATLEGIFGFDRISVGNFFGKKTHEVDEIRIGTDFRAVTGEIEQTEPETPLSLTPVHLPGEQLASPTPRHALVAAAASRSASH